MTLHAVALHSSRAQAASTRDILGVAVEAWSWDEAIAQLKRVVGEKRFTRLGFLNAHVSNIARHDRDFARALRGFTVLPDGIGVDIAARLLHGAPFPANLNGTDFVPALLQAMSRPLRVGILGTTRDSAEGAVRNLPGIAPQHTYTLVSDGFFKPEDEPAILARLAAERPDILLVAMGVPMQETWIARNLTPAHCTLAVAVGALVDFISGTAPRAPRLMRRLRLEWVFRFCQEPRRLWRRYIFGNPVFLGRVLARRFASGASRR